ncbi:hypothetical protein TIFTF001_022652 [Ficus carica]|uniref:Uncharacterized protein n=1 Tax=Ficus carica TaxID=3494 RepID=A0AA88AJ01_FICCA|nr:hypothetical protein TIFTF001_022652 [Ficus carica]
MVEFCHPVKDELLRATFPPGGQELNGLANHRVADIARWKVGAGEVGRVLIEENKKGDEHQG